MLSNSPTSFFLSSQHAPWPTYHYPLVFPAPSNTIIRFHDSDFAFPPLVLSFSLAYLRLVFCLVMKFTRHIQIRIFTGSKLQENSFLLLSWVLLHQLSQCLVILRIFWSLSTILFQGLLFPWMYFMIFYFYFCFIKKSQSA